MFAAILDFFKELFVFAGCVRTKNGLPPQLPPEREEELIKSLSSADEAARAEARDLLIEHNLRLVAHIAKKYRAGRELDDLISIGSIGLIKAVNTYAPGKGRSLAAYAGRCIENEILMSIRAEKKRMGDVSLSEPIGVDRDGNEITVGDVLSCDMDVTEDVERRLLAQRMRSRVDAALHGREKRVIVLRYGLGGAEPLPQREVGKLMGISRSYVSRIEKKALETLAAAFAEEGVIPAP